MKKSIKVSILFFISCMISLCNTHICGQEKKESDIIDAALRFLSQLSYDSTRAQSLHDYKEIKITPIQKDNVIYMYVIDVPDNGFVIISNEKRYKEVLGYSDNLSLKFNLQSESPLFSLLEHHMNMIDSLRTDGEEAFYGRISHDNYIPTRYYINGTKLLVKNYEEFLWQQTGRNDVSCSSIVSSCDKIYNKFCPNNVDACCGHTYAGCGAVAMGQLMLYWEWPHKAEVPDTVNNNFFCLCGVPSSTKTMRYYNWERMPTSIYSNTQIYDVNNVAGLLRDCGFASQTYYTSFGSAAMMHNIRNAMENTFHYHTAYTEERSWVDVASIFQTEINALRPIMCQAWKDGNSIHTYLIDGYNNTTDLYHVNFGWGGTDNGWYDLGCNGYYGLRNFLTEIYPNCDMITNVDSNSTNTIVNNGETYTIKASESIYLGGTYSMVVKNGGFLLAEAGNNIVLKNGFRTEYGSIAKIRLHPICDNIGTYIRSHAGEDVNSNAEASFISYNSRQSPSPAITPNSIDNILSINSQEGIKQVMVYTYNGQCVMQTKKSKIDVSSLPSGLYILFAITEDNTYLHTKFYKN